MTHAYLQKDSIVGVRSRPLRGIHRADIPPQCERFSEDVVDAVLSWAVKLYYNDPTPETHQAFERWLRADRMHALAWQRMYALKRLKHGHMDLPSKLALDALRAMDVKRQSSNPSRRSAVKLLSLAGIAVVAGWIASEHMPWQYLRRYARRKTRRSMSQEA